MANKHTTLVSLFDGIAEGIRKAEGTTEEIVADTFPERIELFNGVVLNEKFNITVPGVSTVTLPKDFTPTCFYNYGGYWWVGGYDSGKHGYIAYSTDLTSWTVVCVRTDRVHPVYALGFDLDHGYVYVFSDTSGDSGRSVLRLNNFFSYANAYNYWTPSNTFTEPVTINGYTWVLTGSNQTGTADTSGAFGIYTHSSISHNYFHCCAYNGYPVAVSDDGYYTYKSSPSATTVAGEHQFATDFEPKTCAQMGDYLVVAGTKSNGTYLYYAKGTPGSLTFKWRRIMDKAVVSIGLAYADGLYVMAYMDGENLRFWAAESIENNNNISGFKVAEVDGMTGVSMAASGKTMGLLSNNGGKPVVASYTMKAEVGTFYFTDYAIIGYTPYTAQFEVGMTWADWINIISKPLLMVLAMG